MTTTTLNKTARTKLTARAWGMLDRACNANGHADRFLHRAEQAATPEERAHRRMGANFCGARYRLSVKTAARSILLREALTGATFSPDCWAEVMGIREDIRCAWAVAELVPAWADALTDDERAAIASFDYAAEAPA